jgi:hypothetical protein
MKNTKTSGIQNEGTAGSLGGQLVNAIPLIRGRRLATGGAEAASLGSVLVRAWSPSGSAAFAIVRVALRQQLDPGNEEEVSRACESLARTAVITREAARDVVVRPLVEPALRDVESARARGISRLRPDNARAFVDEIMRKVVDRVDLLASQVQAAIEPLYGPERLLEAIDGAVASSNEPLATVIAALDRIRSRVIEEDERIDRDLRESAAGLENEREGLRVVAVEANRSFFGRDRQLGKLISDVSTTVPKIGNGRITALYLPLVRRGLPAVVRALDDRIASLDERQRSIRQALDRLSALAADAELAETLSGRVLIVGAPRSPAAVNAEVERVVTAARGAVSREMRDLIAYKAPVTSILDTLLESAALAVSRYAPTRSLDDLLLADADPEVVARRLDAVIETAAIPLALSSNADRPFLSEVRCVVHRVAAGSRLPALLAEHAGYRPDTFCAGGPSDRLEALVLQPGIDIEQTAVFRAGRDAYESEIADRAAPPIHVFSDEFVANLSRKGGAAADRPDGAKGRRSAR